MTTGRTTADDRPVASIAYLALRWSGNKWKMKLKWNFCLYSWCQLITCNSKCETSAAYKQWLSCLCDCVCVFRVRNASSQVTYHDQTMLTILTVRLCLLIPAPGQTGRLRHYLLSSSVCSFVHPFVSPLANLRTQCILKTNEPTFMPTGTSCPWSKVVKPWTLWVRLKVNVS